jgi:NAD(P)-dependent dehydrogenase (short-subunit alcohol dehydrogenase family)
MKPWTVRDIPDQTGRLAVITGATGGIGFETALALAVAGADVVLTGRNAAKGEAALQRIRAVSPRASIRYEHLDLASLRSVRQFVEKFSQQTRSLDLLINNAGVMTPPERLVTEDGFELQFGTNYLSHFALTAPLLPLLRQGTQPRVVNISSGAHRIRASIHFDDLQWERRYEPWPAYAQSKLAMLMFAFELQRRSDAHGWGLLSNAAHPGYARTDLIANGPGDGATWMNVAGKLLGRFASQSAADGALPTLFAATAPQAQSAGYYGPKNAFEMKGPVTEAIIGKHAKDIGVAKRLWDVSEQLTGAQWPPGAQG